MRGLLERIMGGYITLYLEDGRHNVKYPKHGVGRMGLGRVEREKDKLILTSSAKPSILNQQLVQHPVCLSKWFRFGESCRGLASIL